MNIYEYTWIYVKFNLNVNYPSPYERGMILQISKFLMYSMRICWEKAFYNIDVNKKVLLFNENVLNIIRNFIPAET